MTDIPICERYRGIGIHADQSAHRIATAVKPQIDKIFGMEDAVKLAAIAADPSWSPEARLLAAAMAEAVFDAAAEGRLERPDVDILVIRASVAGLNTAEWRDQNFYCSLLDTPRTTSGGPIPREKPLANDSPGGAASG